MKSFYILVLTSFFSFSIFGQSSPGAGSLAFIGFQNSAPDGFAIVLLQDFPGEQVVYFTDNGWSGSMLFDNEETIEWTLPMQGLPAGTVVQFRNLDDVNTLITPLSAGVVNGVLLSLSASGEQILAYTGSLSNPNFLAGISSSGWLSNCNTTGQGNTNSTCLPDQLSEGLNAFSFTGNSDVISNGFFNIQNFSGSLQNFQSLLLNPSNWLLNNSANVSGYQNWPSWNFEFIDITASIVQFNSDNVSALANAETINVQVLISPALNIDGTITISYSWSEGLTENDFSLSQSNNNNPFELPVPANVSQTEFQLILGTDLPLQLTEEQTITFIISGTFNNELLQTGLIETIVVSIQPVPVIPVIPLFINEIMAQNTSTLADEFGEFDDWIEIYNAGDEEVDLAGFHITDNLNLPTKYQFPAGTELTKIPANGFRLVWADNQDSQGPMHTNFGLSANGEAVGLYANGGTVVVDTITFGAQQADVSYERLQDGLLPWVNFNNSTPELSNSTTGLKSLRLESSLTLYPNPASDAVYLFNPAKSLYHISIQISDLKGRQLAIIQDQNLYSQSGLKLPVDQLTNGVYIVSVNHLSHHFQKRLVIARP